MYIAQMSSCFNVFAYIIIKGLWHTGKISGMGSKLPDCQKVQVFPKIKKAHPFSQHSSCPWESVFFSAVEGGSHLPKDPVLRHCRSGCSRYHCESPFAFPQQRLDQDGMAILRVLTLCITQQILTILNSRSVLISGLWGGEVHVFTEVQSLVDS